MEKKTCPDQSVNIASATCGEDKNALREQVLGGLAMRLFWDCRV